MRETPVRSIQRLIKNANFRLKASIEELETDTTRGIAASNVSDLVTGSYITNGMMMIITGPAGTGYAEKESRCCTLQ